METSFLARFGIGLQIDHQPNQIRVESMSNRERKRTNHEEKARPLKKTAVRQEPSEVVKVSLPQEDEWAPIVGMLVYVYILAPYLHVIL